MSSTVLEALLMLAPSRSRGSCTSAPSARFLAPPLVSFNPLPLFFPFSFPPFFSVVPFLLLSLCLSFALFVSVSLQIYEEGNSLRIERKRKQFQPWHWTLCQLV